MTTKLQFRRANTAIVSSSTLSEGEFFIDTERNNNRGFLTLHDGTTAGGIDVGFIEMASGDTHLFVTETDKTLAVGQETANSTFKLDVNGSIQFANTLVNNLEGSSVTAIGGICLAVNSSVSGLKSSITGGANNQSNSDLNFVGGGANNWISANADYSSIVGGLYNLVGNSNYSVISGGQRNSASSNFAVVSGGANNWIDTNGEAASIGGGKHNRANGQYSYVLGGDSCLANNSYSIALGRRAKAVHDGSLVFSDSANSDFSSDTENQFKFRASGGFYIDGETTINNNLILKDDHTFKLGSTSGDKIFLFSHLSSYKIGHSTSTFEFTSDRYFKFNSDTVSNAVYIDADTKNLYIGNAVFAVSGTTESQFHNLQTNNILPEANNTYILGSSVKRWSDIYANNVHADNINGFVTDSELSTHTSDTTNPHEVTKTQVTLGNVPNVNTANADNITSGTLTFSRFPTTGTWPVSTDINIGNFKVYGNDDIEFDTRIDIKSSNYSNVTIRQIFNETGFNNATYIGTGNDLVLDPNYYGSGHYILPMATMEFPDDLGDKIRFFSHSYSIGVQSSKLFLQSDDYIELKSDTVSNSFWFDCNNGDFYSSNSIHSNNILSSTFVNSQTVGDKIKFYGMNHIDENKYKIDLTAEQLNFTSDRYFRFGSDTVSNSVYIDADFGHLYIANSIIATAGSVNSQFHNLSSRNVYPEANNTYGLGSSLKRWSDIYANNVHADNINGFATDIELTNHTSDTSNPHSVTKTQVGLSNVPNVNTANADNITSGTLTFSRFPTTGTWNLTNSLTISGNDVYISNNIHSSIFVNSQTFDDKIYLYGDGVDKDKYKIYLTLNRINFVTDSEISFSSDTVSNTIYFDCDTGHLYASNFVTFYGSQTTNTQPSSVGVEISNDSTIRFQSWNNFISQLELSLSDTFTNTFPQDNLNSVEYSYNVFYDEYERVLKIEYDKGNKIYYTYDSFDNITKKEVYDTDGTTLLYYYVYNYNENGNISRVEYTQL